MTVARVIDTSIAIDAPPSSVRRALTDPALMKQWMAEPEMQLEIAADWTVGGAVVIAGRHHVRFENRGTVLRCEPDAVLEYTHLSSVSRLPDRPESYTTLTFRLSPAGSNATTLALAIRGFPSESIFRHFDFYWRTTPAILKRFVEENRQTHTD
jgi:uncharacterized protein YndB with AHSA1/START domain